MKTTGEINSNLLMPGVTVKSRNNVNGIDPSNSTDQSVFKAYANPRNSLPSPLPPATSQPSQLPINNKEIASSVQSYKGFYTWLSSPKTMYNHRKMAVIAPTQHHT